MGLAGLGSQTKPCIRLTFAIICITIMTIFYFLNDMSNVTYNEFVWNLSNDYSFPENLTGPFQQEISDNVNASQKEGYLVYSPSCRLPDIDPYHESIRSLVKKVNLIKCSPLPPLTSLSNDKLVYNESLAPKYANKNKMTCCYQEIKRPSMIVWTMSNPDDSFNMSPCIEFNKTVTLKDDAEFLMVKCTVPRRIRGKREVYGNMHARIIKKAAAEEKTKQIKLLDNQLSVLLLGIDSISRLNLFRTMPNTVQFLKENNFTELKGYNKIDDNTFPNLIGILTGMTVKQYGETCWNRDKEMDNCPLIWFNASKLGYVTTYVEDEPTMGTFNYHKKGFRNPPTDYYFRPFMLAAEKYMKIKRIDSLEVCIGPTLTADHILSYAKDFIDYFKNSLYFALVWMNTFSHNNVNSPSSMDKRIFNFFNDTFTDKTVMNSTAIIFLSDHGIRFGKIRETYVGWLEERLPFIYIWLPEWYRNRFKARYDNLIVNSNRLTSPYDLHLTIKDLIVPPNNIEYEESRGYTSKACPQCVSLFETVPWNRTCENAGITEHWCTCSEYRTLSTEGVLIRAMVHYAVKEINNMLESSKNITTDKSKCAKLGVKRVLTVRSMLYDKPLGHNDYVVLFETLPGAAIFETTIRHEKTFKILDSISRINAYYSQSNCMPDSYLRKYCFCTKKTNT